MRLPCRAANRRASLCLRGGPLLRGLRYLVLLNGLIGQPGGILAHVVHVSNGDAIGSRERDFEVTVIVRAHDLHGRTLISGFWIVHILDWVEKVSG